MTPALLCSALALATLSSAACSKSSDATASSTSQSTVDVVVDETGFVPAVIKASVNQPLTLKITRKTDRTCATEIVIKSAGINQPLPLNQTVPVTVTPKEKGDLHFACAMDHIGGKLVVQ
jgi:plastocyanin domain-containing protein